MILHVRIDTPAKPTYERLLLETSGNYDVARYAMTAVNPHSSARLHRSGESTTIPKGGADTATKWS